MVQMDEKKELTIQELIALINAIEGNVIIRVSPGEGAEENGKKQSV